ncbi:MAG: DUF2461 domain-containing protein [Oscillospiraceae bacterium]|nr:DUF2461 domain-containing protein [Oscillospiraceae bacterium]
MFQGFSPETIDFLWGIRMNNNREWFMAHKEDYIKYLYEPMKELAAEISKPFVKRAGMICKTSRIYRDMRMPQPVPYKESLWTCIRRDSTYWMEEPCLCFEIMPDGYRYGFLFYSPPVSVMNALRAKIAAAPDAFLKILKKAEKNGGIPVVGKEYAKQRPCPDERLRRVFQLKNMLAIREEPVSEKMFSPELAVTVRETLKAYEPLLRYCQDLES